MEEEDDIIAMLKCIWCCYKANTLTGHLLNLFHLHNCCLMLIGLVKVFKSRLPISEFSGYHYSERERERDRSFK